MCLMLPAKLPLTVKILRKLQLYVEMVCTEDVEQALPQSAHDVEIVDLWRVFDELHLCVVSDPSSDLQRNQFYFLRWLA